MKSIGGKLFMVNKKKQLVPRESRIEEMQLCCLCGKSHPLSKIRSADINGRKKYICNECAETVHGLI
jgi:formylmethanofuran dehydrogenase subunit E